MPAVPPTPRPRRSRRRPVLISLGIVLAVLVIGLIALPALVRTAWMRGQILTRINAALAPGRLNVERFDVSWTGPTRLVGFELIAPDGARVAEAPVAELNQSLGALLLGRRGPTVLLLDHAALAIRRGSDGRLDLVGALQSVIAHPDPTRDLTVRITHGSLVVRGDKLAEPITAQTADLDLHIPPSPQALTWHLDLGHETGGSIVARGELNRWTARDQDPSRANIQLDVEAKRWPVRLQTDGITASGQLDGTIELARQTERWQSVGNLRFADGSLTGKVLAGDTLTPGLVTLVWDGKQQTAGGWSIRRLTLDAALGSVRAEGSLAANLGLDATSGEAPRIEGRLDLAALARQIPHALRLRPGLVVEAGTARFVVESPAADRTLIRSEATVADLAARDGDRRLTLLDPATFTAEVVRAGSDFTIRKLIARTAFGTASASGRLDDLTLTGSADLGALRRQVADWIDIGKLDGSGRADLTGSYRVVDHQFIARLAVQGHELRLAGVTANPIERPLATLDLTVTGQPGGSPWPENWDMALVSASAPGASGRVELRPVGESVGLKARFGGDLPGDAPDQRIEATLDGTWTGSRRLLTCDRVAARVVGPDASPRFEFAARGEFDGAAGSVRFDPIVEPGSAAGPIRLASSGVRVTGLGADLAALRIDGGFEGDLPTAEHWSARVFATGDADGLRFGTTAATDATTGTRAGSLQLAGRYDRAADRVALLELEGRSAFGALTGTGAMTDLAGARRFDVQGQIQPDYAAITAWLVRTVEPGAKIAGGPRPFRLAGVLGGPDPLGSVDGEIGLDLIEADVYGMKLGPAPVVVRAKGGQILVDPISTTLNEGHIRLEPEIVPRDSTGAPVFRLGKNSSIREAQINDEVSRRVLAFVAPILEGTTRASGRVSVDLDRAEFPLTPGRSKAVQVDGQVVFADVAFAPGDLANDLLGAIGRRDAVLRLDRPVTLTIADGRINQSGLAVPIGDLTRIEVAGWVDFDKNLALTASLPVTPAMLGNNALLTDIAAGTMVRLPINGTLNQPRIDQEAFAQNMKAMGKSLLTRGATRGALELLMRFGRPAAVDPNVPPPPTPAERKALRQERRMNRNATPDP